MKKLIKASRRIAAAEGAQFTEEDIIAALKRLNREIDSKIRIGNGHVEIASYEGDYYQYYKLQDLVDAQNRDPVDLSDTDQVYSLLIDRKPVKSFSIGGWGSDGEISEARSKYLGIKTKHEKEAEFSSQLLDDPRIHNAVYTIVKYVLNLYYKLGCKSTFSTEEWLNWMNDDFNIQMIDGAYALTVKVWHYKYGLLYFIGKQVYSFRNGPRWTVDPEVFPSYEQDDQYKMYDVTDKVTKLVKQTLPQLEQEAGLSSLEFKGGKFIFTL